MDQKIVEEQERQIDEARADINIHRNTGWRRSLIPAQGTMHLMAKAAVAVYETVLDSPEHKVPHKSTEENES